MTKLKLIHTTILILGILSFSSCKLSYRNATSKEAGAIPPEFGAHPGVLLFLTSSSQGLYSDRHKTYQKGISDVIPIYYKGKFEIIDEKAFYKVTTRGKYADLETYPYYFFYDVSEVHVNSANGPYTSIRLIYYVFDRKNEKKYASKGGINRWKPYFKGYLKNLNAELRD